jgi:hypothetical protein
MGDQQMLISGRVNSAPDFVLHRIVDRAKVQDRVSLSKNIISQVNTLSSHHFSPSASRPIPPSIITANPKQLQPTNHVSPPLLHLHRPTFARPSPGLDRALWRSRYLPAALVPPHHRYQPAMRGRQQWHVSVL